MAETVATTSPAGGTPSGRLTYGEFLAREGEDVHVEWVAGEVVEMSPVSDSHDALVRFLSGVFWMLLGDRQLGELRGEPFQMKSGSDLPGRSPDLLIVLEEHRDRLRPSHLEGPADLVVEVLSPGSRGTDHGEKFAEYEQGGVREYWLLDPAREVAQFYVLDSAGVFRPVLPNAEGIYQSAVVDGLWLQVEWLWSRPAHRTVQRAWRLD